MGTNYYLVRNHEHIGKRSAAGFFCFDCKKSLCKMGEFAVHHDTSAWWNECPECGKVPVAERLKKSSIGIELGLNTDITEQKQGVRSCSSFTFAIDAARLKVSFWFGHYREVVVDEYGRRYTMGQFLEIITACPINFYHMVGEQFS